MCWFGFAIAFFLFWVLGHVFFFFISTFNRRFPSFGPKSCQADFANGGGGGWGGGPETMTPPFYDLENMFFFEFFDFEPKAVLSSPNSVGLGEAAPGMRAYA